ncbi:MAG: glycosyltransferase family 4 protein [Hyphomicrobiaceae bacterium]|nr:glycosyltransferase family 4 protein [Hyphomicrobiaceae bacterium]
MTHDGWIHRRRHDVVFYTPWIGSILSVRDPRPSGGAETQILLLARELARRGASVALVVYGRREDLPREVDGVLIVPRRPYRRPDRFSAKVREALRVWHALARAPAKVVVYRSAGFELLLLALYTRVSRSCLVYSSASIADFDYRMFNHPVAGQMFGLGLRLSDLIVVQTEDQVAPCTRALGRRPVVIKSIAEPANSKTRSPQAFLWIGGLRSYKRPLEYIALARALPEAKFWMVGVVDARLEEDRLLAARVAAEADKLTNLELISPRPRAQLQELVSDAVAIVNTSDFEGMPNVLLEGWSQGIPALVLAHDPGGVVETYGLGAFAGGSRERFVTQAREQWLARGSRDQLSHACQAYVEQHHGAHAIASQWLEVLASSPTHATA